MKKLNKTVKIRWTMLTLKTKINYFQNKRLKFLKCYFIKLNYREAIDPILHVEWNGRTVFSSRKESLTYGVFPLG